MRKIANIFEDSWTMDSDDELLSSLINEDEPQTYENSEDIVKLEVRDDDDEFGQDFEVRNIIFSISKCSKKKRSFCNVRNIDRRCGHRVFLWWGRRGEFY